MVRELDPPGVRVVEDLEQAGQAARACERGEQRRRDAVGGEHIDFVTEPG